MLKKGFQDLFLEITKSRVKEAEETGAEYLVSMCPFCYRNLTDAIEALRANMKDLTDLIIHALN